MGHKLLFSNRKITIFLALRFFKHFSPTLMIYYFPLYRDEIAINVIKRGHDQSVP